MQPKWAWESRPEPAEGHQALLPPSAAAWWHLAGSTLFLSLLVTSWTGTSGQRTSAGTGQVHLGCGILFAWPAWVAHGHSGAGREAGSSFQNDVGEGHYFPCGRR